MKNILYVDDHSEEREAFSGFFENRGYSCVTAHDADTAMLLLEAKTFDIVISDYQMPGCSGKQLIDRIKAKFPTLPCIIVSNAVWGNTKLGKEDALLFKQELDNIMKTVDALTK